MYEGFIIAMIILVIICMPFLIYLPFYVFSNLTNKTQPFTTAKSSGLGQKITNSISKYILNTIASIIMLLIMFATTYAEAKPIAFMAVLGLIAILKYDYKVYFDVVAKDGLFFNGTIVKAYVQTAFSGNGRSYHLDFNYSLEIETDNGEYIKCLSKVIGLVSGERIENAYVTRRTKLLLYYHMPQLT